ncbi:MAG: hypothetical protein LBB52_04915 [Desulfovibrio sp.]|jgi:hypothetical protein|nr:hypothetical protein [Desulfovibrio sp.]
MPEAYSETRHAFTFIYENNLWEYGSGIGSLAETTLEYRYFLEKFIAKNNIKTIVDFGCGDWNFSRYIYWWGAEYIGYDAVETIVENNSKLFSTDTIKFYIPPTNFGEIKPAELLIVKDVLQHWPSDIVKQFLASIKGKFQYILATNSQYPNDNVNKDIRIGQFRPVNLLISPFNIQAELVLTYDIRCTDRNGKKHSDLKHVLLLKNW